MKQRRTKILQIQPECHDRSHDSSDLAEQIVSAFPRDRFEVTSAFLQGLPTPAHPTSTAEHTHYFKLPDNTLRGLRLRLAWTLYRFCRKHQFDVVICNRYKPVSALLSINILLRIPVCIGISHGLGEFKTFWRRKFTQARITNVWRFVGVSPAVRDHLVKLNCGFTQENTVAITNAFDVSEIEAQQFSRAEAREKLGLPQQARIVGAIGRLVPVKGHIYLIKAFASIHSRFPNAHLAIIGEGREEDALRNEIDCLGLQSRIHLLGWQTRAKQYVQAFDIWTMPSLREGLGLALLEGMSGHLPIIASNIPAMRPLIDGAGGLHVSPANIPDLANALETYLSASEEELNQKGELAYQYLRAHHDIADYRNAYLMLVETTLKELKP